MADQAFAAVSKPSLWYRFGFHYHEDDLFEWRNEEPKPGDWWTVGAVTTRVKIHFSFLDRLRLLISGTAEVTSYTRTNVTVDKAVTRSAVAVLPPSAMRE